MSLRVAFMGTPDFALPTLRALLAASNDGELEVVAVYTQPPRPAGRGKALRPTPIHAYAEESNLEVRHPASLRNDEAQEEFAALGLDIAVVVAYGLILPEAILNAPRLGCVNVHASLLPRWRGAAPIHRAIMAGDEETGITIMQMDAGLDTGDILLMERTAIKQNDTTQSLHDQLADMGAKLIVPAIRGLNEGSLHPKPQSTEGVTYADKIEKAEARIDWQDDARSIDRKVRGLCPFPGAWTSVNGERLKILAGHVSDSEGNVGILLDDKLLVGCGQGSYRITKAQRAGKAPMEAEELLRGFSVPIGAKLE